jgi:hypothetical protein
VSQPDRIAAGTVGLLVLAGAIATYLVMAGGLGPLLRDPPAGGGPTSTPSVVVPDSPRTGP